MKARALIVTGPNEIELSTVEIPAPEKDEVLIQAAYSCISPGTELRCMSGEGEADVFPYVPGYSMGGVVVETGKNVSSVKEGDRVFCEKTERCSITTQWGGHVEYAVRKADDVVPLPDTVNFKDASIATLGAIAYHGSRFSQVTPGKRVAVVGLGPIGHLSALIHHALGADVLVGDISQERVKLLTEQGIEGVVTGGNLGDAFLRVWPDGADVIVDSTGFAGLIPKAIGIAKDIPWDNSTVEGARYVVQGSYAGTVEFPYMDAFMKELSFYLPRSHQKRDMEAFIDLLAHGQVSVDKVISDVREPADAAATYQELIDRKSPLLAIAFRWSDPEKPAPV